MSAPFEPGASTRRRVVLHFAGFEPLDAEAHRKRHARAAEQARHVWGCEFSVGALDPAGRSFDVAASGDGWRTESRMHVFDLAGPIEAYRSRPLVARLAGGYAAAGRVVLEGGLFRYLRHAWRFALFFIFPFLLMTLGLVLTAFVAAAPVVFGAGGVHLVWSAPLALAFFRFAFLPFSHRFHTLHLFSDWQMAVALAHDGAGFENLFERFETDVRAALREPADDVLITSHSIGTNVAIHVIGALLEDEPALFAGRSVRFVTLGGAALQCAFLDSADRLRARVGLIARTRGLFWLDVQCLTDVVNFYRCRTLALCGHAELEPARMLLIRFKHMLYADHYRRIKADMLRVHRQYVLASDRRAPFDFALMTAGPLPAEAFADFSPENLPHLAAAADEPRDARTVADA